MMSLTVLGSSTPNPGPNNPCSGYLVTAGATRVLLEAGSGILGPLQQHVSLADLDAIWVSHLHADHSADLLTAFYALVFADIQRPAPLPLFGPPGIADRLRHYLTNSSVPAPIAAAFDVHELHDGHTAQVGELRLESRAVSHGIPAFGVRVSTATASLAFSGDTAPCAALVELAEDCDALLCESESDHTPDDEEPVHHTPEETGMTAQLAQAGRLIVTHVGPFLTPDDAVRRARTAYDGAIDHAAPGRTFAIGSETEHGG